MCVCVCVCVNERERVVERERGHRPERQRYQARPGPFQLQTLIIHKLGFNKNYHTFTSILLVKIVLRSKFPCTEFINYKIFEMRSARDVTEFHNVIHISWGN